MNDAPDDVTPGYPPRIGERLGRLQDTMGGLGTAMRGVEAHSAGFHRGELARDGAIASSRERLGRVDRRPDLTEPTP